MSSRLDRRRFLATTAATGLGLMTARSFGETAKPIEADLLLRGGLIFDGSGKPGAVGDVALAGGRIVAVGRFQVASAKRTLECQGLIVAPGFIDLHTHCDRNITSPKWRTNLNYLYQGCTTVVTGNCGGGEADVAALHDAVDRHGAGANVAHLIPQGQLRRAVMKASRAKPSAKQLADMERIIDRGMEAGAWGMSTGLIYTPSGFADVDELAALSRRVARHGGIYASHIRDEGAGVVKAVAEAIEIGRRSGAPVHVSHFKSIGKSAWGLIREAAALIEKARAEGLKVTADQYPYTASSTGMVSILVPFTEVPGGTSNLAQRMKADSKLEAHVRQVVRRQLAESESILMLRCPIAKYSNRTIHDVARAEKTEQADVVLRVLQAGGCGVVNFAMSEDDVRFGMSLPWVATGSDGRSYVVAPGLTTHPRSFGTFARKIGRYALKEKVISTAHAIRSASGLPADILGMTDRGYLRPGAMADVVVLDPKTYLDQATFEKPAAYASGVRHVFLAGQAALTDGVPTKSLPGRALRHASKA